MSKLALGTLIKIGSVVTAGTAIIVPIAVSQNKGTFFASSHSSNASSSQSQDTVAPPSRLA